VCHGGGRECAAALVFLREEPKTAGNDDEAAPVQTKKMRSFLFQGQNRNMVKNELVKPTCKVTEL
jgi:hypothetical protein